MNPPASRPPRPHPHNDLARALTLMGVCLVLAALAAARYGAGFGGALLTPLGALGGTVAIDGWVYRKRGESFLISHPGRFALTALWSGGFWGFFEAVNFRLDNWHYVGAPAQPIFRWAITLFSFATVVPLLLEITDLLDTAGLLKSVSVSPYPRTGRVLLPAAGAACLGLPLMWPDPFFPLVWAVPFLALEPVAEILGAPSLLSDWKSGVARRFALLALAGLIAGFIWQLLNVQAEARWVFSLPHLDHWKILEMPVLGYLGFVPFAFSVHTAGAVAARLWDRAGAGTRALLAVALILWVGAVALGVDRFSRVP